MGQRNQRLQWKMRKKVQLLLFPTNSLRKNKYLTKINKSCHLKNNVTLIWRRRSHKTAMRLQMNKNSLPRAIRESYMFLHWVRLRTKNLQWQWDLQKELSLLKQRKMMMKPKLNTRRKFRKHQMQNLQRSSPSRVKRVR